MAVTTNNKLRPYTLEPKLTDTGSMSAFHKWLITSLNTLIGQQVPPAIGSQGLNPPTINPTSSQIVSAGSRTAALTTNFGTVSQATAITLYWDGSNNSTVLRIYRDDNTISGPFPGHQLVTGLIASTTYFFYPYFDETLQRVLFVSAPGAHGTPPIAYTAQSIAVAQQQILRGRVQLAANLAVTGVATTGVGTGPATNAGGGGTGGGTFLGSRLSAP